MAAIITVVRSPRLLTVLSTMAVILLFVAIQATANATVPLTSKDFELDEAHHSPRGIWSDGSTLWVAENDESNSQQRILAYYLSSGGRRNHEEFYFVADDRDVQGIWSDGTVMWIADGGDRKIYAYSLESQSLNNHDRLFSRDISLASSNYDTKEFGASAPHFSLWTRKTPTSMRTAPPTAPG